MRVSHVIRVCAQALYFGQAAVARDPATRAIARRRRRGKPITLHGAANAARTRRAAKPAQSLWYASGYAIGALAGLRRWLEPGFVVETERQVEAHLRKNTCSRCPKPIRASRAVVQVMRPTKRATPTTRRKPARATDARSGTPCALQSNTMMRASASARS